MNELIKIQQHNNKSVVSARELHFFLESKQEFANWIKNRISKYGLIENQDYVLIDKVIKNQTGRPIIEYALTIDAAKELSMVEGNAKGKQARQYFIETEKKYQQAIATLSTLDMIEMGLRQAREHELRINGIDRRMLEIEARTQTNPEYYTVVGYATLNNMSIGLKVAANLGKKATKMCREHGYQIEDLPDPRFGRVHTYPKKVLEYVFNEPIL